MRIKHNCKPRVRAAEIGLMVGTLLISSSALAVEAQYQAHFEMNPFDPSSRYFKSIDPPSGLCAAKPTLCADGNIFNVRIPVSTSTISIAANETDPRATAMFAIDGRWHSLPIQNWETGHNIDVQFRLIAIGGVYEITNPNAREITGKSSNTEAHKALWGQSWANAPSPCRNGPGGSATPTDYMFLWRLPATHGTCVKTPLFDIANMRLKSLDMAYELITPSPLEMNEGVYSTGTDTIPIEIGPGGDIDIGDKFIPSDDVIDMSFRLTVKHGFILRFPHGADRLALIPQGGWQQWTHRGRRPEKLFADQNFYLSSSQKFSMRLECEHDTAGGNCGIQNAAGDLVPVSTGVTLPSGFRGAGRREALSSINPKNFQPEHLSASGTASLHFEVSKQEVDRMTVASEYSGNVTVLWDSEF